MLLPETKLQRFEHAGCSSLFESALELSLSDGDNFDIHIWAIPCRIAHFFPFMSQIFPKFFRLLEFEVVYRKAKRKLKK